MVEFSPKTFRIANYVFTVFILIASLMLIRDILTSALSGEKYPISDHHRETAIERKEFTKKNINNYAPILEKNPFGPSLKLHPVAKPQEEKTAYKSPSDLLLVGTAVEAGNSGHAIFEDKARSTPMKQEVFALGEEVYDYGILTKIGRTSARLTADFRVFTLSLPDEDLPDKDQQEEGYRERANDQSGRSRTGQDATIARKLGEKQYVLDSRKVQESLENPEKILTDARLLPNIRDGRQEGFTISEVIPGGLYHSLGLRNGDTLLRINGLKISNPEVAIQAMSALRGMNTVNLDIIRNDKKMSMSYQIQ